MKKKLLMLLILLLGCACLLACSNNQDLKTEEPHIIEVFSQIDESSCYLCYPPSNSLLNLYAGGNSIGILSLNTFDLMDLDIVPFNDNGTIDFTPVGQISISMRSFEDAYFRFSNHPDRRYVDVTIDYKDTLPAVDYDFLSTQLCQSCLNEVLELENEVFDRELDMPCYVLIDFSTKKLYSICQWQRGYYIEDYVVKLSHKREDDLKTELLIFFTGEYKQE